MKFVVWRVRETTPNLSFVPVHFGAKKYGMGEAVKCRVDGVGGSSQRVALARHGVSNVPRKYCQIYTVFTFKEGIPSANLSS